MKTLPQIEEKINKVNKKTIAISGFLSLGLIAAFAGFPIANVFIAGLPFLADGLKTRYKLNKKSQFSLGGFFNSSYQTTFKNWFEDYLNNSDNLTEKKYKIICTNLWLNYKNIRLEDAYKPTNQLLDTVSFELLKAKETTTHIDGIFRRTHNIFSFVEDDLDNERKISIGKKVYQEFNNIGLLGNNFSQPHTDTFKTLAALQDYQLTPQDMQIIKKDTRDKKETMLSNRTFDFTNNDYQALEKIVIQLDKLEDIVLIQDYFQQILSNKSEFKNSGLEKLIETKKMSFNLDSSLSSKEEIPTKRNKI